jgi:plasmid stability protein
MADLTIREIEPAIVEKLEQRAQQHGRSVEDEHRMILREKLLGEVDSPSEMTFEAYLRTMPDVGTDGDFARIEGTIRDVALEH